MKTLLERAKGSPLDIFADSTDPVGTVALLSPHTKQITSLILPFRSWADIRRFSELDSGPLPLLRTLVIDEISHKRSDARVIPRSFLLFGNAVNLQKFRLRSIGSQFLNHFVFPNLTSVDLFVTKVEGFRASQLLGFLKASPTLQVVCLNIATNILFDFTPRERAVVLPNVESLCLVVSDVEPGYNLVTHISCPVVKRTSLTYGKDVVDSTPLNIFPPASWNAIARQYTRSPIEEVTLVIKMSWKSILACQLTFQSPDKTIIRLCFEVNSKGRNRNDEMYYGVFSQASRTIRDIPQLANVKRLHIHHTSPASKYIHVAPIISEVGRLFQSLGPLEILTLYHCDMRPYFAPSVVFPPIEELTILHPFYSPPLSPPRENFEAAMVGLAESQHALGVPFGHVTVRMGNLPKGMAERLRPWVGAGDCYNERYEGDYHDKRNVGSCYIQQYGGDLYDRPCAADFYNKPRAVNYWYSCLSACMCTPIIIQLA